MDPYTGEPEIDFQGTDTQKQFRYKNGISGKLSFEQVNEITWKLTNGEMTNVPACHGFWGGYRTTKAIAWVIDVGVNKPAWLARYKDQCCGPMTLKEAKAAALAMAKGSVGDYRVSTSTAHLNGLAARLSSLAAP
ncbi:MAG: hypothetical protein ABWZ94_01795 [Methyloceanibacter sp.]